MSNHTATWLRGQHQYVFEEGDACEQTPKHAQSDSVATINTMAGGRANVEAGLQTGLDIVATMAWWDYKAAAPDNEDVPESSAMGYQSMATLVVSLLAVLGIVGILSYMYLRMSSGLVND